MALWLCDSLCLHACTLRMFPDTTHIPNRLAYMFPCCLRTSCQRARVAGATGHRIGGIQRPPNYQSIFARWPLEGFSSPIPGAPSSEGVASCSLDGGMGTRHLHAPVKKPIEKLLPLAVGRDRRRRALASWHVTASLIHLHCSATTSRPSHRGRPTRPHGPARRSGANPPLHPLER